jgi:hypothetical protein
MVSVDGVPDEGEDVRIVLAGSAAEVGVEPPRPELRCSDGERDVVAPGGPALPDPDAMGWKAHPRKTAR